LEFRVEAVTPELISEISPLLSAHHDEVQPYKDIAFEPDFESYLQAQSVGAIRLFTCRSDGRLRGYSLFFVRRSLHAKSSLQAAQDLIYLDPELRGRGIGRDFILWCDEQMKAMGVQVVYQHLKASHNHGPLLEKLGYEILDHIYARRLQ
jgi:GNAT superfamily N-acetyltransferase